MSKTERILRKLDLYRKNPEIVQPLSNTELADLVVVVLSQVNIIEKSIKDKKLDLEKKLGKEITDFTSTERQEYEKFKQDITKQIRDVLDGKATQLDKDVQAAVDRLQARIDTLRDGLDGKDGVVTDAEIGRAAQIAAGLVELPDFDLMVATAFTSNPQAIRDGLELLSGQDRYRVQIEDVDGLAERLQQMRQQTGNSMATSKPAVVRFVNEAITAGEIVVGGDIENLSEIGDVSTTAPTANQVLTWNDSNQEWEPADAPGASGGEANTASNLGTGEGTFASKVGVDLRFKSLVGGSGVTLSSDANEITVDADSQVDDTAYNATTWNGVTGTAPSKNAVRDQFEALDAAKADASHTHTASEITDFDAEVSNNTDVAANTSARHNAVTIAAGRDYISLTGQELTLNQVDLTTDVTGDLPFANIEQIATNRILGRSTAGTGDVEELADGAVRDIIGLATTDSPQFAGVNVGHATDTTVTRASAGDIAVEGNIVYRAGGTDVPVTDGGTGASTAAEARTNLGLVIGTDVQAHSAVLDATTASFTTADETKLDGIATGATANSANNVSEMNTGTDATKFATADSIAGSYAGTKLLVFQLFESDTAVTTGDGKIGIPITPELNGMNVVDVQANVYTKGVTGTTDIQIRRQRGATDVDVLSVKVTLGDEYYASDGTVNTSNDDLVTGDMLFADVDAVHSGTAPNGLTVVVIARLP